MSDFEEQLRTRLQSDPVQVPVDLGSVLESGHEAVRGRRLGWTVAGMATLAVVASIVTPILIASTVPAVPSVAPVASPSPIASPAPALAGTAWEAVRIGGVPRIADTWVALQFSERTVQGSGGCNGFSSVSQQEGFQQDGDRLTIAEVGVTLRLCAKDGVGQQESRFLAALSDVARFRVDAGNLVLLSADGTELAELAPFGIDDRTWALDGQTGRWAGDESGITLKVEGDRVSGWSGCGDYTADLARDGDTWTISDVTIVSPVPCPSVASDLMVRFTERLEQTTTGKLLAGGPVLRLGSPNGDLVFRPAR